MGGHLQQADIDRIARTGVRPVTAADGPRLLDAALASGHASVVATPMDIENLRKQSNPAPILRSLARTVVRKDLTELAGSSESLMARLANHPDPDRLMLDIVQAETGKVLGGVKNIDPHKPFAELGFDSLTSVQLRNALAAATGLTIPATLVFDYPTPAELAKVLLADADVTTDFTQDIRLAEDIVPAGEVVTTANDPRHVLLTGATGFLGAFLLRELMTRTQARIHCLIRGTRDRLVENLKWYRLVDQVDLERIEIVEGDLAKPRLGLSEQDFDRLAKEIDVVYHAGATVNWLRPYAELKVPNVRGTEEILRLAAKHRTVPVHHVSTTGVFAKAITPGVPLKVTDPTGPAEALPSSYLQSKWVTEQVIGIARQRGLPVSVYRVDVICGDQEMGACQTQDFIWLSLKGLVQAGAIPPGLQGSVHMVPVDYASAAIVELAGRQPGTYQLFGNSDLGFGDFTRRLAEIGYELTETPDWRAKVEAGKDNPMLPLLDAFELMMADDKAFYPLIDTAETDQALGENCPPVTRELFDKHIEFFVRSGYFPEPDPDRQSPWSTA
jgi:thioester reductase-like protein